MRAIERTSRFKRDYKRERRAQHAATLDSDLVAMITVLAADMELEARYRDHALTGNWSDHRDCHVRPNLVLMYRKPNDDTLQLIRLGSHAQLGL